MDGLLDEYISGRRVDEPLVLSSSTSESLRNLLETEKKRVSEIPALVDKLVRELDERKEKITRVANLLSPIRRLPAEMLTEIFMNYIEPDGTFEVYEEKDNDNSTCPPRPSDLNRAQRLYNALPRPLLLSQICAQWRNLVQLTPRLWTRICFSVDYKGTIPLDERLVHEWLQRSGSLLIDIGIKISDGYYWREDQHKLLDCLVPYSERWRSLALYGNRMKVDSLFCTSSPLSLPNLQRVIMPSPIRDNRTHKDAFRDAPKLTQIKILLKYHSEDMSPSGFLLPLSNITVLCLRNLPFGQDFLDFMCACPLLEDCQLHLSPVSYQNTNFSSPVHLPCLKNLTLKFGSREFLDHFCLPSLELLVLEQFSARPQAPLLPSAVNLQKRSGFQLRKFRLQLVSESRHLGSSSTDTIDALVEFLKLNPTLEILDLEDCRFDIPLLCCKLNVERQSQSTSMEPLVPNLIRLRIAQMQREQKPYSIEFDYRDYPPDTDSDIADMVISRWNPPQRPDQGDIDGDRVTGRGAVVKRLKDGFTFRAYSRELCPEVLSRLKDCETEGMPLRVTIGRQHYLDS